MVGKTLQIAKLVHLLDRFTHGRSSSQTGSELSPTLRTRQTDRCGYRNRIRAGADAAMGYPRFGMLDLLKLLGGLLVGLFRSHAAREAETAFLRQQLVVLKR